MSSMAEGTRTGVGTREYNLALVRRLYSDLYNQGPETDIEKISAIIGPTFVDRGPNSPDLGGQVGPIYFALCVAAFSKIPGGAPKWSIDEVMAEGDTVVVRWTSRAGQHTSSGISMYTIDEQGLIGGAVSQWSFHASPEQN